MFIIEIYFVEIVSDANCWIGFMDGSPLADSSFYFFLFLLNKNDKFINEGFRLKHICIK